MFDKLTDKQARTLMYKLGRSVHVTGKMCRNARHLDDMDDYYYLQAEMGELHSALFNRLSPEYGIIKS